MRRIGRTFLNGFPSGENCSEEDLDKVKRPFDVGLVASPHLLVSKLDHGRRGRLESCPVEHKDVDETDLIVRSEPLSVIPGCHVAALGGDGGGGRWLDDFLLERFVGRGKDVVPATDDHEKGGVGGCKRLAHGLADISAAAGDKGGLSGLAKLLALGRDGRANGCVDGLGETGAQRLLDDLAKNPEGHIMRGLRHAWQGDEQ